MAKCPFIVHESEIVKEGNRRINYADFGGCDYIFYDHDDGFGKITRMQFCQLIGRKQDVFECLNESEWRNCYAYRVMIMMARQHTGQSGVGTTGVVQKASRSGEVPK